VLIFFAVLIFCAGHLGAAPLESGFALAPNASASAAEKAAAYQEARSRVLIAADTYIRTPYRHGGVTRNGLDCSGLVFLSFQDALEIAVPRRASNLYSWVNKIPIEEAQPGDLVFFRTTGTSRITHVGIFTGDMHFIHSASRGPVTGVIYSSLEERYWSRTYAGAGRVLPEAEKGGHTGKKKSTKEKKTTKK